MNVLRRTTESSGLILKKMVIFTSGDGSDVSRIAREPLFGIDKHTITDSLHFGRFWKFSVFSCFFRHVRKMVGINFPPKKSGNFTLATLTFPPGLL